MFTKTDIEKYFLAEKSLSTVFIVVGAIAIIMAVIFFFVLKTNWYKGAAASLLIIGIIQFAASYTVYKKTDAQRKALVYAYDMNPPMLKEKELPRMEKVITTFKILFTAELLLLVIGVGIFLYFRNDHHKAFWVGLGAMLAIEAAVTFTADMYAKKRADTYTKALKTFVQKSLPLLLFSCSIW